MSQIKDKYVSIFEIENERDLNGNEVKVKRYIHGKNKLFAYVRELSHREKYASKELGVDTTILFRINHNKKVRVGQYIEFREYTYLINSIDSFEYYQRDLTIQAKRVKPEVYDYEEYFE